MSALVPLLTEVNVRAWGLDDPRVCSGLRAENQPGRHRRAMAVRDRARAAGWPAPTTSNQYKAATAAVKRLEGVDFEWNNTNQHRLFRWAAYESRSRRGEVTLALDGDAEGQPLSIFDE